MSEAAAVERSPDDISIRRWQRYRVNVPIRVIVSQTIRPPFLMDEELH